MSKIKFTPDENSTLPAKPLKDVGVPIAGATATYEEEPKLKGLKLSISLKVKPSIGVFNGPDDIDEDEVLGTDKDIEDDFGPLKLEPTFKLTNKDAWVKYRFSAEASASANAELGAAGLKVDGNKEVVFADYRRHDPKDDTRATIVAELLKMVRTADNPLNLSELGEKDALLYAVRGQLTASVSLAWSDVFSWTIGSLAQLLGTGQMLRVALEPTASFTFSAAIRDDFRVIFTRASPGVVRIAVCKSKSREVGLGAKLGATAKWSDPKQLESALKKIKASALGEVKDKLAELLEKGTLDKLDEKQRALAIGLMERLGIPSNIQDLGSLKEKWSKIQEKIDDTFKTISEAKVAAAFEYEYLRINTREALLVADLPEESFGKPAAPLLNDLLRCDIQSVLKSVQDGTGKLGRFLRQDTLLRKQAWGFSLGIGSIRFGGKDQSEIRRVIQRNEKDEMRVAYMGKRGYTAASFGSDEKWTVDFKAQMAAFSAQPLTSDFDYGLYLRVQWTEKKLSEEEFRRYLDFGVIWRVLSVGNANELLEKYRSKLKKKAAASVEIKIDGATFKEVLALIAKETGQLHGARALAKAMPYLSDYDARRNAGLRESTYTPLWLAYLGDTDPSPAAYVQRASAYIGKQSQLEDELGLAFFEKAGVAPQQSPFTFAGQIQLQGNPISGEFRSIATNWTNFIDSLRDLNHVSRAGQGENFERIGKIYKSISRFSDQWLYVRASGAFLMDMIVRNPEWLSTVERTFKIEIEGEPAEVVGGSAAG